MAAFCEFRLEETDRRERLVLSDLAICHETPAHAELARARRLEVLLQPLQVQSADGMSLSLIRLSSS